jgi:hypothetical protein
MKALPRCGDAAPAHDADRSYTEHALIAARSAVVMALTGASLLGRCAVAHATGEKCTKLRSILSDIGVRQLGTADHRRSTCHVRRDPTHLWDLSDLDPFSTIWPLVGTCVIELRLIMSGWPIRRSSGLHDSPLPVEQCIGPAPLARTTPRPIKINDQDT